jgi:hypothetical protein
MARIEDYAYTRSCSDSVDREEQGSRQQHRGNCGYQAHDKCCAAGYSFAMRRPRECKWDALRPTMSARLDVFGDGAYDGSDQRGIIRFPSQIFRTFLHVCH